MPDDERYSLTELADLGGVTPRTVRYYLAQGLLPSVGSSGPGSKYDQGHLARLRLIRRLQAEHLPLAEIRRRLEALTDDEIVGLAGQAEPPPPSDSALDYLRSVLDGSSAHRRVIEAPAAPVQVPPPRLSPASVPRGHRTSEVAGMALREAAVEGGGPLPAAAGVVSRPRRAAVSAVPAAPERAVERSQWERVVITPDVELHIRRPLVRAQSKQVDRLITIARELLEEDRP